MSPIKPRPSCLSPLCPQRSVKGSNYCIEHKRQIDSARPTSTERGYDQQWRKLRKIQLNREPLCKQCHKEGKIVEATVVDHIQPHRGDQDKLWDSDNLQSLCESCHNRKTAKGK